MTKFEQQCNFLQVIAPLLTDGTVIMRKQEVLAKWTTFGVGGRSELFLEPKTAMACQRIMVNAHEFGIPVFVLGHGSNVLVSDHGLPGITMHLGDHFAQIRFITPTQIEADAGCSLAAIAAIAAQHELSGLESLAGIPGSLGGAVLMNAGAYDHEMSEIVVEVKGIMRDGTTVTKPKNAMEYGYRQSWFMKHQGVVLTAVLQLQKGVRADIYDKMAELAAKREASQPLEAKSGGSGFKRPVGYFAGKLISDAGFKGKWLGHAGISAKHAGFVIQDGDASATEIFEAFLQVRQGVHDHSGVWLSPEVRLIGEFGSGSDVFNEGQN